VLELVGRLFVGHERRLRAVPGAAIRVDLLIGSVRQRPVDLAPLIGLGRPVHRRPNQWVAERHGTIDPQEAF